MPSESDGYRFALSLYSTLAQLVEHLICNQEVAGSSPVGGTVELTNIGMS